MKIIWGMVIPFKFAVGAVRRSGRQDNSSPLMRTLDSLWRQETQTQTRLPLCQHHMGKTWSLLQCSAWIFGVFLRKKNARCKALNILQTFLCFHLFDTITQTSQLVHKQVRPKLTLSTYYHADLPSPTHHMWATFFWLPCQTHSAQQEWPLLYNSSHFASSIFHGDSMAEAGLEHCSWGRAGSQGSNKMGGTSLS